MSSGTRFVTVATASLVVLAVATVLSLGLGSHPVAPGAVVDALLRFDPSDDDHLIVVSSRLPRAALCIVVGVGLSVAGAVMQSLTRNPLAEPGLLGLNAGASLAVVVGIVFFGVTDLVGYLGFAFLGAALAAVAVYALGTAHRSGATPARMALAGAAIAMFLSAITTAVLLSRESAYDQFRFWAVGTLQGRGLEVTATVLPFIAVGAVGALLLARPLNALALGDDSARSLGVSAPLSRGGGGLVVVLLAGAATAAAGPIGFIGLVAPHVVRMLVGSDHRFLIPATLVVGPATLMVADVLGRVVIAPGEIPTAVAAAIIGGPVFVALVRSRRKIAG
ncbi:FecCD family ABC transporter permease [Leucobacter chromiisoli]|uniref:FecCD family ABC transporter permease n=1 Tax=Leucobacter chromiisoli TaxID=2796471 RepID=UPI0027DD6A60|nr:iron ABC transporter permease [Leucobacter chromiisoli]